MLTNKDPHVSPLGHITTPSSFEANFMDFDDPNLDIIGSFEDFMPPPIASFGDESVDEVNLSTLMTRGEYHALNKKLDSLLFHTRTFSTTNFENVLSSH